MKQVSFNLFEPRDNPNFMITPNLIMHSMLLLGFFCYVVFDVLLEHESRFYSFLKFTFLITTSATALYFSFSRYDKYKPLLGRFNGALTFDQNGITANRSFFALTDIKQIDLELLDFRGKTTSSSSRWEFDPAKSQGVDNFVEILDANSNLFRFYFQIKSNEQRLQLSPFLNELIRLKKISVFRVNEILS